MKKLTVETHVQKSFINEKETYYVAIGEGAERVVMNIGKTSYEGIRKLIDGPVQKIQIAEHHTAIEGEYQVDQNQFISKGTTINKEGIKKGGK